MKRPRRNTHGTHLLAAMALSVAATGLTLAEEGPTPASPTEATATTSRPAPPRANRASYTPEIRKYLAERKKLLAQLRELDRQAVESMKRGKEPVVAYAKQTDLQERLDLIELRIQLLATREGIVVQLDEPKRAGADDEQKEQKVNTREFFSVGRARTLAAWDDQCRSLLRSIDFKPFLKSES